VNNLSEVHLRIYLASPLGFSEIGREFYVGELIPLLQHLGHEVIDPWILTHQRSIDEVVSMEYGANRRDAFRRLNKEIGRNNRLGIDRAESMLAILDGVDVDSGTASEVGYGYGRGLPIVGYRGDFRLSADNEGSTVNLQVEYFITESGGRVVTRLSDVPDAITAVADSLARRRGSKRSASTTAAEPPLPG
jgi:nucleoside 2-deoxyribosyltransferase